MFAIELGQMRLETLQSVSGLADGHTQSGQITITRGMDKSNELTEWIKESRVNHNNGGARNVSICRLDAANTVAQRFNLRNAWASSWSASDEAIETVQIDFDEMVIE
ncbi:phage tail protein [Streptomyces sp. NBC_01276]|uniref:phage tail protein n=1 Tax=Streptomyces sp. NBC_01276 TaxID=2903808 RepID=UPI00352D9373